MSRKVKELLESELRKKYGTLDGALVVDVSKLTGVQANQFRGKLHAKGIEMHVVKNRATRRALAESPLAAIGKSLAGPCALVTGRPSLIELAKEMVDLVKEYPALVLKGGVVEGQPEYLPVETVAKMRGRLEVLGDVAAMIAGPGRRLAACLRGPGGRLAGCLKAIADKPEVSVEATPAAA